ncbi:hypothetical protein [Iodobacter ciconiae]|uniref:YcxB-like protein domain-containing protein n=1 Tax=Iodobacter ciconiae TaxID=2496266 RepID=A0A3S8ZUG6_9NEIS|nr:hypothetical protein [Iodobacter ciconiae]AZN37167.1 hypothetical protein EJO50_12150 [Iodobacter ciconiae]
MKFQVTDTYIKNQNKKIVYLAMLFAALSCAVIVAIARADKVSDMIFPVMGLYFFIQGLFDLYKKFREGWGAYPTFEINNESAMVHVSYNNMTISFPLSEIDKLRLQYKSGQLESILLNMKSEQKLVINGYENLEVMAEAFQRFIPTGNVKVATWFHH